MLLISTLPFYFAQVVRMLRKILEAQINELPRELTDEMTVHLGRMQVSLII